MIGFTYYSCLFHVPSQETSQKVEIAASLSDNDTIGSYRRQ